jgi:long-chain acyl-CoA synthetase
LDPDGFLYLTGRRSDVIKTSTGRKVAPGRVEAAYAQSRYIEQIVVIGDNRRHLVALVVPAQPAIEEAQASSRPRRGKSTDDLTVQAALGNVIAKDMERIGRVLAPHERVVNFAMVPQGLSVARGELTANLKIRRDRIASLHADLIERLYEGCSAGDPSTCQVVADK